MPDAALTFSITSWQETPAFEHSDGSKMTRASVERSFTGDVQGNSRTEYVMAYRDNGSASFSGFEHFNGTILGKEGGCLIAHQGVFAAGVVTTDWCVVEGSGTGNLAGLAGKGQYQLAHAASYNITMALELAK